MYVYACMYYYNSIKRTDSLHIHIGIPLTCEGLIVTYVYPCMNMLRGGNRLNVIIIGNYEHTSVVLL